MSHPFAGVALEAGVTFFFGKAVAAAAVQADTGNLSLFPIPSHYRELHDDSHFVRLNIPF